MVGSLSYSAFFGLSIRHKTATRSFVLAIPCWGRAVLLNPHLRRHAVSVLAIGLAVLGIGCTMVRVLRWRIGRPVLRVARDRGPAGSRASRLGAPCSNRASGIASLVRAAWPACTDSQQTGLDSALWGAGIFVARAALACAEVVWVVASAILVRACRARYSSACLSPLFRTGAMALDGCARAAEWRAGSKFDSCYACTPALPNRLRGEASSRVAGDVGGGQGGGLE